ncbi:S49 family peptidase [bacterium]|nr:S49 family peptidase [bacterium]
MPIRPVLSTLVCLAIAAGTAIPALAEPGTLPLTDYRTGSWMLPQSPSVTAGPVGGLFNPAAYALNSRVGLDVWTGRDEDLDLESWGLALGRRVNFSVFTQEYLGDGDDYSVTDFQLGLAGSNRAGAFGLGYRWGHGETGRTPRHKALVAGFVGRPSRWVTLGASHAVSLEAAAGQTVVDVGLRPLGRPWLTLFADWTADQDQAFFGEGDWGAGLEVRPLTGLHLGGRVRESVGTDDLQYTFTLGLTVGETGLLGLPSVDENGDDTFAAVLMRSSPPTGGMDPRTFEIPPRRIYYSVDLENKILTYQKHRWFDDKRVAWLDLLPVLEGLQKDDKIDLVAVNVAGLRARPSLIWELRQQLERIKASGKTIVIHGERLDQSTYFLASVADRVTLDPWGQIELPGTVLSRTYLKGTLEKLGLGFQEHRYFKYKSAAETLSRDSMSDADREQRQRIVDVIYGVQREGTSVGRTLAPTEFDRIVDEQGFLTAEEALAAGLVDTLMRWNAYSEWLGEDRGLKPAGQVPEPAAPRRWDEQWGRPRRIPVVYALGVCAMDEGIKGRTTSAYMRRLARDPSVAAVVLRADSPGGDGLASDQIAGATRILKEAGKPVIVSQGDVAASGGYWISMDGTEILTTPLTVTGSIGVISGWVWDDGFAGKMGVTSDVVSRGRHADLYSTVNLPFLGGIPRRAMTPEEMDRTEKLIRNMYAGFVSAVAEGRGLEFDAVAEVAQGRVWMGEDAVEHGLCDGIGSLADAIARARELAGIPDWQEVEITEYPPRPLIELPSLLPQLPSLLGVGTRINGWTAGMIARAEAMEAAAGDPSAWFAPGLDAAEIGYLKAIADQPGRPLLAIEPGMLPQEWRRDY